MDVGCGNGYNAGQMLARGCTVVGIDLSEQGVAIARAAHPAGRFEVMAADGRVLERLGEEPFDLVVSTEVVEHLYDPRSYVAGCFGALRPGGRFVVSTPYHGYLKNLAIAAANRWDSHANPLWDGGHDQVVEPADVVAAVGGSRVREPAVSRGGAAPVAVDVNGDVGGPAGEVIRRFRRFAQISGGFLESADGAGVCRAS